jgi:hypothetical protein
MEAAAATAANLPATVDSQVLEQPYLNQQQLHLTFWYLANLLVSLTLSFFRFQLYQFAVF